MGTYNNSEKEIVCKLNEALNEIEGDFDTFTLFAALEKCKEYPYHSEGSTKKECDDWDKYINTPKA